MASSLSQIPIATILTALLENPDAQTFPWGGLGNGSDIPRSVLSNEVSNRPLPVTVTPTPARPITGLQTIGGSNKNQK